MGCNCKSVEQESICQELYFVGVGAANTGYKVIMTDLAVDKAWEFGVVSDGDGRIEIDLFDAVMAPNRTYEIQVFDLDDDPVDVERNEIESSCFYQVFFRPAITPPPPVRERAAPVLITPNGGSFQFEIEVSLSSSNVGAEIYFTLDGTTPSKINGTLYTAPFLISSQTIVTARAFVDGLLSSVPTFAKFEVSGVSLSFLPDPSGVYNPGQLITLLSETGTGTIYYTTDGSEPTILSTLYTAPFAINVQTEVRALVVDPPRPSAPPASATYSIQALSPVVDTASGTYITSRTISATNPNPVGSVQYRINNGAWVTGSSVEVTESSAVDWRVAGVGLIASELVTRVITIQCAAPTIVPNGGIFEVSQSVSIVNNEPGGIAYYTINGTTPTESSLTATPFSITATTQVRTRAFRAGCEPSDIVNASFALFQRFELAGVPTGDAGTRRLYRWDNSISAWGQIQPLGNVDAAWIDAQVSQGSQYLLASTATINRLLYSLDSGSTWDLSTFAGALASSPTPRADKTGQYVLCIANIGSGSTLHYSNNYGQSFAQISPLGLTNWEGCFVDREYPLIMYAWRQTTTTGNATVIVKSVDGGTTWNAIYSVLNRRLAGFAAAGSKIFIATRNQSTGSYSQFLRSLDGGANFAVPSASQLDLMVLSPDGSILLGRATSLTSRVFRSIDNGATFTQVANFEAAGGQVIRINSFDSDNLRAIVGTSTRLYRSTNAGVSFVETQPAGNVNRNWQLASL